MFFEWDYKQLKTSKVLSPGTVFIYGWCSIGDWVLLHYSTLASNLCISHHHPVFNFIIHGVLLRSVNATISCPPTQPNSPKLLQLHWQDKLQDKGRDRVVRLTVSKRKTSSTKIIQWTQTQTHRLIQVYLFTWNNHFRLFHLFHHLCHVLWIDVNHAGFRVWYLLN